MLPGSIARKDHVSVCICTYHRNGSLVRLLRNLSIQETKNLFSFSVVVVDNDARGFARETVEGLRAELGLDITYGIEPVRTIPAARNRALRLAHGNYIGIIDDDEFPPPNWLATLYQAIATFQVDGAVGPVFPFFEGKPPDWLVKGRLCDPAVHRTGTLLNWTQCFTGNNLIQRKVFDEHGLCFDESFRTGGSDQDFFRRAMDAGYRFVAVQEAPVYEVIAPSRWTRKYWVKRALVNGYNSRRYAAESGAVRRFALLLKSMVALPIYGLSLPVSACLGQHRFVQCLEKGAYHLSRVAASAGVELWKRRDF